LFEKKQYISLKSVINEIMQAGISNVPELLKGIGEGNEVAFKQIYEYYFPKIQTFAFRVLHDNTHAQEVAQEVMLEFWQMGSGLEAIRNLDAFLKTIAKRRTIDTWRRCQTKRAAEHAMWTDWKESNEETEERVILNETRQIIEEAIHLLPPQQRTVYQLCQQEGLKYEEAARRLDIAPGTVQTHMKLALRFLRSYLRQRVDIAILLIVFNLY